MKVSLLNQACDTVKATKNSVNQISKTITSVTSQLDFRIKGNVESRLKQIKTDLSNINSETDNIVNTLTKVINSAKSIEKTAKNEAKTTVVTVTVPERQYFSHGVETYEESKIDMSDVDIYEENNAIVDRLTRQIEKYLEEIEQNPASAVENQSRIEAIMQKIFSMGISQEDLKKMIPTNYQKTLGFIVLSDDEIKALKEMGYSSINSDYTKGYLPYTEYEKLVCQNEDFKNAYKFLNSLNIDESDKRRTMGMLLNNVSITKDGADFKYSGISSSEYAMFSGLVNNYLVNNYDQESIKKYVKQILCDKMSDETRNKLLKEYVNNTLETGGIDAIFDLKIGNNTLRNLVPSSKQEELGIVILSSEEQAYLKSKGINNLENLGVKLKNGKVYYLTTAQHKELIGDNTSIGATAPSALSEIGGSTNTASVAGFSGYAYKEDTSKGFRLTYGNSTYNCSESERLMFYAIVYAEAGGNQDDALAVASVIMNRYDEGAWKGGKGRTNTIANIITAPSQFSAYGNSKYNYIINGGAIPDYVKNAVDDALLGIRNNNYDSFRSKGTTSYSSNQITSDGNRYKDTYKGSVEGTPFNAAAAASIQKPAVDAATSRTVTTPPAAVTEVTTDAVAASASITEPVETPAEKPAPPSAVSEVTTDNVASTASVGGEVAKTKGVYIEGRKAADGYGIAWLEKAKSIARKYGIDEREYLALLNSESGVDGYCDNGVGYVGFMQMSNDAFEQIGITKSTYLSATPMQQLDYCDQWMAVLQGYVPKTGATAADYYAANFLPSRAKKGDWLTSRGESYYGWNSGLDANGDGVITKQDLQAIINSKYVDESSFSG